MNRVFRSDQAVLRLRPVAVALSQVSSAQRHIGIILSQESGPPKRLHLAWHFDLRLDIPPAGVLWVDPAVPTRRLDQLAAFCRLVWSRHEQGGLPYAFDRPAGVFDESGEVRGDQQVRGWTCATFVAELFISTGLRIVDDGTWPSTRERDTEWQQSVVQMLRDNGASEDHVAAVERQVGTARFRPEEVAAASALTPMPARFSDVEELARLLLEELEA